MSSVSPPSLYTSCMKSISIWPPLNFGFGYMMSSFLHSWFTISAMSVITTCMPFHNTFLSPGPLLPGKNSIKIHPHKYIRLWYHVRIYDYSLYILLNELSRECPHYSTCWSIFLICAAFTFPYGKCYAVDKLSAHVMIVMSVTSQEYPQVISQLLCWIRVLLLVISACVGCRPLS